MTRFWDKLQFLQKARTKSRCDRRPDVVGVHTEPRRRQGHHNQEKTDGERRDRRRREAARAQHGKAPESVGSSRHGRHRRGRNRRNEGDDRGLRLNITMFLRPTWFFSVPE